MARRSGWSQLTPQYRDRLTASARTGRLTGSAVPEKDARAAARRFWESGGDLRAARGKPPVQNLPAPVKESATRSISGEGTTIDSSILRVWREIVAPAWIPPSRSFLADDAAAALATLPNPSTWGEVHFQPHSDGTWSMTVEQKGNGYPETIKLPDRTSAQAVMNLLSGVLPDDWEGFDYDDWDDFDFDFDVADTDGP